MRHVAGRLAQQLPGQGVQRRGLGVDDQADVALRGLPRQLGPNETQVLVGEQRAKEALPVCLRVGALDPGQQAGGEVARAVAAQRAVEAQRHGVAALSVSLTDGDLKVGVGLVHGCWPRGVRPSDPMNGLV